MIKLLLEVGDKIVEYPFPADTTMTIDKPLRGWIEFVVGSPGVKSWFRLDRVIAVVPFKAHI